MIFMFLQVVYQILQRVADRIRKIVWVIKFPADFIHFEFTNVVIRFKGYKDSCLRVSRKDSPEEQLFDFAFIDFSELAK